jgi:hypothetical protein
MLFPRRFPENKITFVFTFVLFHDLSNKCSCFISIPIYCHLTADCQIVNQTNRIKQSDSSKHLNIDLAIEIEM